MNSGELEDLTQHINQKISSIRKVLELRSIAKDPDKRKILQKIGQDLVATNAMLDQLERHVVQQRHVLQCLKDLKGFFLEDLKEGQHMLDNPPPHMPKKGQVMDSVSVTSQSSQAEKKDLSQKDQRKKISENHIKEMQYITTEEFDSIPQYMKGRVLYSQLNATVKSINEAVKGKYSILQQPVKTLSVAARKLHQRFKDEESKDTKGHFFIVEEDIREFTQMKVDKRFLAMLNMLRHCQRLRELRGGGQARYILV